MNDARRKVVAGELKKLNAIRDMLEGVAEEEREANDNEDAADVLGHAVFNLETAIDDLEGFE